MFAQRRNRLTTHFSEHIAVVKQRMTIIFSLVMKFNSLIFIV